VGHGCACLPRLLSPPGILSFSLTRRAGVNLTNGFGCASVIFYSTVESQTFAFVALTVTELVIPLHPSR
jgi:hypothetical protein